MQRQPIPNSLETEAMAARHALAHRLLLELNPAPGLLAFGQEKQVLEQVCAGLEHEYQDALEHPQRLEGLEFRLRLRLKHVLEFYGMSPQDYADLRANLRTRAFAFTRNEQKAEDVVHDTFLAMFECQKKYHGDSSYATWVHSILFNRLCRSRQREKRRNESSLDELVQADSSTRLMDFLKEERPGFRSPEEAHVENVRLDRVLEALPSLLTDRHAMQAFNLVVLQGLEYEEAAAIIGITKDYLYRIICTGRKKLQHSETLRLLLED
ncbi:MAG: RNA polymerase sigma factor [Myxococcota bacterium]